MQSGGSTGSAYVDDLAGWDEMLPTIDPCTVHGRTLPDHGDVWSIPWTVEPDGSMRARARSLPLTLRRSITLDGPRAVFGYALRNHGDTSVPWMWAAHPLLRASPSTRLALPVDEVVVIGGDRLGPVGSRIPVPDTLPIGPACDKVAAPPELRPTWASLVDDRANCSITFRWSVDVVPYLAVWRDGGAFTAKPTIAIEPMTAYYDDLERAVAAGMAPRIAPGDDVTWDLTVELGPA